METPLPYIVHEEFEKRIDENNRRVDKRLSNLEASLDDLRKMTVSIERLSNIMESMLREQKTQGERLGKLEERDGTMWRKVVSYIITTIAGIVIGYIFMQLGMK